MFGEFIKQLRIDRGVLLKEFCKMFDIDVIMWSAIERGKAELLFNVNNTDNNVLMTKIVLWLKANREFIAFHNIENMLTSKCTPIQKEFSLIIDNDMQLFFCGMIEAAKMSIPVIVLKLSCDKLGIYSDTVSNARKLYDIYTGLPRLEF